MRGVATRAVLVLLAGMATSLPAAAAAPWREVQLRGRGLTLAEPAPPPDGCPTAFGCLFGGWTVAHLGVSSLSYLPPGLLAIDDIGNTGLDGIEVNHVYHTIHTHSGHLEWIELGVSAWQTINPPTLTGDFIQAVSVAQLSAPGTAPITLTLTKNASNRIVIAPDFDPAFSSGTATYRYEAYDGSTLTGQVTTTVASVTSDAWPARQGFSFVSWAVPTTVTLPVLGNRTANLLLIEPQGHDRDVEHAQRFHLNVKAQPGSTLSRLVITELSFGTPNPP